MNKNIFRSASLGAAVALLAALPSAARAQQFQQYVALGDSLTAGWQSGCLVQRNQLTSYPSHARERPVRRRFRASARQGSAAVRQRRPAVPRRRLRPPASLTVEPMSEMDGPLNALLPRPYNDLAHSGGRSRRPDDPDPRRPQRHDPREALGPDPAQRHGLALRRHERRRPGGGSAGPGGELRDRDPLDRQQQHPRRLDLGHRRGRRHAGLAAAIPGVLLGDHRGHPARRAAGRGQHPRRDLDPVLDARSRRSWSTPRRASRSSSTDP